MSYGLFIIFLALVAYAGGLSIVSAYAYVHALKDPRFKVFILLQVLIVGVNFIDAIGLVLSADLPPGSPLARPILLVNDVFSGGMRAMLFHQLLVGSWVLQRYPVTGRTRRLIRTLASLYGIVAVAEPSRHLLRYYGLDVLPGFTAASLRLVITVPLLLAGLFAIARWMRGKRRLFHPLFSKGMDDLRLPGGLLILILALQCLLIAFPGRAYIRELQRMAWAGFFGWMGYWNIRIGLRLLCIQRVQDQTPELPPLGKVFRLFSLTHREGEVCELLLQGLVLKEVGARLGISANTARNHLSSVFRKAGVNNRVELIHKILQEDRI